MVLRIGHGQSLEAKWKVESRSNRALRLSVATVTQHSRVYRLSRLQVYRRKSFFENLSLNGFPSGATAIFFLNTILVRADAPNRNEVS